MIIETKFALGDRVYAACTKTTVDTFPCPDCNGTKKWKATSPAGVDYEFACPRCSANYGPNHPLSLRYTHFIGYTCPLTIGQIRPVIGGVGDSCDKTSYMCRETGVGSGTVWYEDKLSATEAEAQAAADAEAQAMNDGAVPWVKKQYDEQLALSDYELSEARSEKARKDYRKLDWDVTNLLGDINDAADLEEVKDAVERFKARGRD